ncbi:MAG: tRNA dihydrouridine synthase DusB [Clostridia bacterium]|nr:tRNA dihydrouridine synthase DusB [Clostridia bacterium]
MGFKLADKEFKHGLCLAPMAGYTDRAMRRVCHDYGAEYTVTEMVSAKAVTYGDKKTFPLAKIYSDEGPCAVQIFGSEPSVMAEAAGILFERAEVKPFAIDINMGCPVNKIFSNGEGSALMKNPELIGKIVDAVNRAVKIPVTVKLRAGVDEKHINAVECALAAEDAGASLVCVHGRTRVQMYGGSADREIIKNVKSSLHIPVITNGDILSGADALSMLADTGADGIAVGRGAVGCPFLFSEILAALEGKDYTEPTVTERIDTALRQLSLVIEEKGEQVAVTESRKQIALYLRAFRGAARIRADINRSLTYEDVKNALYTALSEE